MFSPGGGGPSWLKSPDLSSFGRNRKAGGGRRRRDRDGGSGGDSLRMSEPPRNSTRRGSYSDYERSNSDYGYKRKSLGASTHGGDGLLRRNPPTLTVILSRLEACLPAYCEQLSTPSVNNAARAARVLDDSLYPKPPAVASAAASSSSQQRPPDASQLPPQSVESSPRNSTASSNRAKARLSSSPPSPLSTLGLWARKKIPSNLSSMSSSPYLGGATSSRGGSMYGDPALEAEWNRMVNPLMLLAGAEGLYGGLEHVASISGTPMAEGTSHAVAAAATSSPPSKTNKAATRKRSSIKRGGMRKDDSPLSPEPKARAESAAAPPSLSESPPPLPPGAEKLWAMYGKVREDLIIVKEILCDPILGGSPMPQAPVMASSGAAGQGGEVQKPVLLIPPVQHSQEAGDKAKEQPSAPQEQQQHSKSEPQKAAESLAHSISILTKLCDARRSMISVHADLVLFGDDKDGGATDDNNSRPTVFSLASRCDFILNSMPKGRQSGGKDVGNADGAFDATEPMIDAMRHEIKATAAALRAMGHLQTCSFFETILHVKRLKLRLGPSSPFHSEPPCSLEVWLRHMLSGILSLMNIYYDRVDAYGSSTYGFQKHIMVEDRGQNSTKKPATTAADAGGGCSPQGSSTSQGLATHLSGKIDWYGPIIDLDTEVVEFLYCHEERNGAALAVTLIFNPKDCSGPSYERGFTANGNTPDSPPLSGDEKTWPAIYLRTTNVSGDPDFELASTGSVSAAATLRRGSRRVGSKGMSMSSLSLLLSTGGEMASQGLSGIKRPSYGGNTSRGSLISIASEQSLGLDGSEVASLGPSPAVKAAEYGYGPSEGTAENPSWPHNEMAALVTMLHEDKGKVQGTSMLSPQQADVLPVAGGASRPFDSPRRSTLLKPFSPLIEEETSADASFELASPVRSVVAASPPSSPFSPPNMLQHTASSYHFVQVHETMWLSVMIKGEYDERRVRRKTRGITDDEIRLWISQFAEKLRLSRLFCLKSVFDSRKESKGLALPTPVIDNSKEIRWRDAETNEYLTNLKESLGLKPSSPLTAPLKSPYSFGGGTRKVPEPQQDDASAAAFFLGADLGKLLGP